MYLLAEQFYALIYYFLSLLGLNIILNIMLPWLFVKNKVNSLFEVNNFWDI